jgi:hypothetical protein
MVYILAKQLSLIQSLWIPHHAHNKLFLKTNILYHANKHFVTNVNVEKKKKKSKKSRENSLPPTHPPLHCNEEEIEVFGL